MPQIGSLNVKITGNSRGLRTAFRGARKEAKGFRSALATFKGALATAGVVAAVRKISAVVRQAVAEMKQTFDELDRLAKTSDKLGIAPDVLAGLRHGARLSGVEVKQLDTAIQRMIRRISEAGRGKGEAIGAIAELGLDARRLAQLSPDKQLEEIAEALASVETQSDRVRLAFKLFDAEGVGLVNMLKDGRAGLHAFVEQARQLGIAFSREELARIEQANDALARLDARVQGIKGRLAVELAPIVEALTGTFDRMAVRIGNLVGVTLSLKTAFQGVAGAIAIVLNQVDRTVRKIEFLVNRVERLNAFLKGDRKEAARLDRDLKKILNRPLEGDKFLDDFFQAIQDAKNAAQGAANRRGQGPGAVGGLGGAGGAAAAGNPALVRGTAEAFAAEFGDRTGKLIQELTRQVVEQQKTNRKLDQALRLLRQGNRDANQVQQFGIP